MIIDRQLSALKVVESAHMAEFKKTQDVLLKTKDGLLKTEDSLLKTEDEQKIANMHPNKCIHQTHTDIWLWMITVTSAYSWA